MLTLVEKIMGLLKHEQGLTDRQITDKVLGLHKPPQAINQACRNLQSQGILVRRDREDGRIGNYLRADAPPLKIARKMFVGNGKSEELTEDDIKKVLEQYLNSNGWTTKVAWGRSKGIDIEATRHTKRWVVEVKGPGSLQPMRVNYFIGILGELLQRMDDPNAKYSIALPDMTQFRNLWNRLPRLAKDRTGITAIFVNKDREIEEITESHLHDSRKYL